MAKLTKAERAWIARFNDLMKTCPSRFGFYTIGDAQVSLYDNAAEERIGDRQDRGDDFCSAVGACNAGFDAALEFPAPVHSTAG